MKKRMANEIRKTMKMLIAILIVACLTAGLAAPAQVVEAKSKKSAVKKVALTVNGQNVTKGTYYILTGEVCKD